VGTVLISLGAVILRTFLRVLGRTLRFDVVSGAEHLEAVRAAGRPVIVSFWHNRCFLAAHFVIRELHRRGLELTVLASQSRDGELVTRTAKPWGFHIVRGSATRGGTRAIRALYRAISQQGTCPVMIPDGPQGPLYHFKLGVAVLAQMSDVSILPIGFAAERAGRIGSWDRLFVPRPFTRVKVTLGPPQAVPRGLTGDALEAERKRLEELLDQLTLAAEAAAGVVDEHRPVESA
jgi:hypothetical protein